MSEFIQTLRYKFLADELAYDGTQLRSLFGYMDHGVMGDSLIAFVGPCHISFEHMVDGEDVLAQSPIRGSQMLHFIIEEFGKNLELAVCRQRLFASIVCEVLSELKPEKKFTREGDDLYVDGGKLSISIATVSPVSALIHFAMNVSNEGTPVKTSALLDLELNPESLSRQIADRFVLEVTTMNQACRKVRWVK